MAFLPDIRDRNDIDLLIESFYATAMQDPEIGHFFTQVVTLDLATHLPKICDFWESNLFGTAVYAGNPMAVHFRLHARSPMEQAHFERWLTLFDAAVEARFAGPRADMAKARARSIAGIMQAKLR